uniref:ORF163 protein n=1 Tax=Turritis glabra TaxID=63678 RepID=A0A5H2VCT1_TURGL|nr:ORF163 protein [Turritis glabra]
MEPYRKPFDQDRKSKGLCFRCGDKWNPGHRCKGREFKYMAVDEGDELDEADEAETGKKIEESDEDEVKELLWLSLRSMAGLTTERSMRMRGQIAGQEVIVLIDSGATSNFIAESVAHRCGLQITETRGFGVSIGNGQVVPSAGKCSGVELTVQDVQIRADFFL